MRSRLLLFLLLVVSLSTWAQTYPTKTVRIISGFTPGGANDILARTIAESLSRRLGKQVVVENRPGAGGTIGAEVVAKSPPDGYTLLMIAVAHCAHGSLYPNLSYDLLRDFVPITQVAVQPLLLLISTKLPVTTAREFVNHARAHPGTVTYGSGGNGTSQHLAMVMFAQSAGIKLAHIPYRGLPQAYSDMIGGDVSAMMSPISTALPYVQSGKLRALAIASAQRSVLLPELPTIAESGLPAFTADAWHGLAAPARTPKPIVDRLYRETAAALREEGVRKSLAAQGAVPGGADPAAYARFVRGEVKKYGEVVKAAGIRLD